MLVRDDAWYAEVEREVARAVSENERSAFLANLLGWFAFVMAAAPLPQAGALTLPLMLRLVAIFGTRHCWRTYRAALDAGRPHLRLQARLSASLAFGGLSWAAVLLPLLAAPSTHPSWLALAGGTLVGVSLVTAMVAPIRMLAASFAGGFLLTLVAGLVWGGQASGLQGMFEIGALSLAILVYAYAASRQKHAASTLIVDKRRLTGLLETALEQARFLATRDALTGLWNRRAFFAEGDCNGPASGPECEGYLLTIDLDHFKQINDRHGHATGDTVLVAVAQVLECATERLPGGRHRAVRLGGEEFVLHLVGIDHAMAMALAELVRRQVAQLAVLSPDGAAIPLSASIGVARIARGMSLDEALRHSDLALYRAKDRGRNQVVAEAA